jgi:hypothetical protein
MELFGAKRNMQKTDALEKNDIKPAVSVEVTPSFTTETFLAFLNFLMDDTSSPTLTLCSLPYDEEEAKTHFAAGKKETGNSDISIRTIAVNGKHPFGAYPRLFLTAVINEVYRSRPEDNIIKSKVIDDAMARMELGTAEEKRRQIEGLASLATSIITKNLEKARKKHREEQPALIKKLRVRNSTFFGFAILSFMQDRDGKTTAVKGEFRLTPEMQNAILVNPVPPNLNTMYELRDSAFLMDLYALLVYMQNYKQGWEECREQMPLDDFRKIFFNHPSVKKEEFPGQLRDGLNYLEEKEPSLKGAFLLEEKDDQVFIRF